MLNQDVTGARPVDIHAHFFRKPISTCSRKRGHASMWNIARRRKVFTSRQALVPTHQRLSAPSDPLAGTSRFRRLCDLYAMPSLCGCA